MSGDIVMCCVVLCCGVVWCSVVWCVVCCVCVCVTCSWDKPVGLVVIAHICVQLNAILNMFCLDWEVRPGRFHDRTCRL